MSTSFLLNSLVIFLFSVFLLSCSEEPKKDHNYSFLNLQEATIVFNNPTASDVSIELFSENSIVQPRGSQHIVVRSNSQETIHLELYRPEIIHVIPDNISTTSILVIPNQRAVVTINNTPKLAVNPQIVERFVQKYYGLMEQNFGYLVCDDIKKLDFKTDIGPELDSLNELLLDKINYGEVESRFINAAYLAKHRNEQMICMDDRKDEFYSNSIIAQELIEFKGVLNNLKSGKTRTKGESISTYNISAIADYLVSTMNSTEAYELSASFYLEEQTNGREYGGKEKTLNRVYYNLPTKYKSAVDHYVKLANKDINYEVVLAAKVVDAKGKEHTIRDLTTKENSLLKFWFIGCKRCKEEVPFEDKLLADYHESTELIDICFSTSLAKWTESKSKGYHLSPGELKKIKAEIGPLGAPRYLLIKDGNIVCGRCPTPSGDGIVTFLK